MAEATQSKIYQKLVETIADRNAIAMVGAGSSIRAGFPNWRGLLDKLANEAIKISSDHKEPLDLLSKSKDLLVYAQKIKTILGEDVFSSQLQELFTSDKVNYNEFHKRLVQLPFHHFLTTNYDYVLQNAYNGCVSQEYTSFDLDEQFPRQRFLDELNSSELEKHFLHVHGSIRRAKHIVLGLEDYNERYINTNACVEALKTILTVCPVVFIGFSLDDDDFMRLLRYLSSCFGSGDPKHFAVLPSDDTNKQYVIRETLHSRYRIEPFFYNPRDNHSELESLLIRLGRDNNTNHRLNSHKKWINFLGAGQSNTAVIISCFLCYSPINLATFWLPRSLR